MGELIVEKPDEGSGAYAILIVDADLRDPAAVRADIEGQVGSSPPGSELQLWIREVTDDLHEVAVELGFEPYRDLWQLRCPLPAEPSSIATRSLDPGSPDDIDAVIGVNNRAFSWHPEQSGMTRARFEDIMAEPWFDAEGLRLYEVDGELKGFCWTKVHADHDPVLGEIFVIAVDPSMHGKGLGAPMTCAGLDHLAAQGIEMGMLYVESDNVPANRTYERIGFTRHHTDRAYRRTIEGSKP